MIQRLLNKFGYIKQKGVVGPLPDDTTLWQSLRVSAGAASTVSEPYSQSVWVYSSISKIAGTIARVPFRFYKQAGKDRSDKVLVEEGKIPTLFNNPNPLFSPEQLMEATLTYLELRGEAFWILENRENVTQVPTEIWVFDPIRFEPIFDDATGLITGWTYQGKKKIKFGLSEIIHFKYFNPYNDVRGLSPIQAVQSGIDQDFFASEYNKSFFQKGASVGGFIETANKLSDVQYNRLLNQFEDRHKGFSKAHQVGILEGGAKFNQAKLSQKDMDFISLKKLTRVEIFAAFGVNEVVLGLYDDIKSFEGIKAAHKIFWQDSLISKIKYIEGMLWSKLFSKIEGGKIWGEFDLATVEALQDDFHKQITTAQVMHSMGWPLNDINKRLQLGMPDVEWGKTWHIPISLVPVDGNDGIGNNNDGNNDDDQKCITVLPTRKIASTNSQISKQVNDNIHWKLFLTTQTPVEKLFLRKLRRFIFEQRKEVLKNLNLYFNKDITDDIFDAEQETKKLIKFIVPLYELAVKIGAEAVAGDLGVIDFVFEPLDPSYLGPIELKLKTIPASIVNTIQGQLRKTITAGIGNGEGVIELATRVKAEYNMVASRAITIARTESASSISAGRFAEMKKREIEEHRWVTAGDEAVRLSHQVLDGEVAIVGHTFGTSQLKHPGDMSAPPGEVINCRCVAIPEIKKG
jgi:HK97 family phage portal protein